MKIVVYPEKILRQKAPIVDYLTEADVLLMKSMEKYLLSEKMGAGLAASQAGQNRRYFAIKEKSKVEFLVNPEIVSVYGEKEYPVITDSNGKNDDFLEGCLSFPDYWGTVKRYLKIKARWQKVKNGKLENVEQVLSGFPAIVFQHESDHLDGILFVDLIKKEGGKFYKWNGKKMIRWDIEKVINGDL